MAVWLDWGLASRRDGRPLGPTLCSAGSDRRMANGKPQGTGMGGGGAGLGIGKQAEEGPDGRLGLGILPMHDFMRWASSIKYTSTCLKIKLN